jgi:hypothetical protein
MAERNEGNVSRQCGQAEEGNKRCEVYRILGPHIILVYLQLKTYCNFFKAK